jgi:hypothetical protein
MRRALALVLLLTASCAFAVGLVEVAVRGLSLFAEARAQLREGLSARSDATEDKERNLLHTQIHPYWGWMLRPEEQNKFRGTSIPIFEGRAVSAWTQAQGEANSLGHWSYIKDYREVDPKDFIVGVFGGSVASNLSTIGGEALRAAIARRIEREPTSVQILNFGSGAFKQPQQLAALMQAALLDIPLDLVINLDGVNEVVLGAQDSAQARHPIFPSYKHWGSTLELVSNDPSEEHIELTWKVIEARRRIEAAVDWLSAGSLLTHSMAVRGVVALVAQRSRVAAATAEQALQELTLTHPSNPAVATLSDPCFEPEGDCRPVVADIWAQSSRLMAVVAEEIGAGYVHALQPSQYLSDTKPFSEEERAHALLFKGPRAHRVQVGYPLLFARIGALRESGVVFVDLTRSFEGHAETLYRDACCHFNLRGNEILAESIVDSIPQSLLVP